MRSWSRRPVEGQSETCLGQLRIAAAKAAPWLMDFQDEVTKFPAGKHDDQVDSLSQFLKWVSRPKRLGPRIRALC